jgi:hopene-associated glycosyltransferase HpnB
MLMVITEILGAASLAIWAYLTFFRGHFWRLSNDTVLPAPTAPSVVVVIPARDEAPVIAESVGSLLQQQYPGEIRLVIVDDNSSDQTSELTMCAARKAEAVDRLHLVSATPPPAGWTGKLWALSRGLKKARQFKSDYVLLTDADIAHSPDNISRLVARAENGEFDLVSLMVKLHCRSFAERALVPAFVFFFFMLYPPAWIECPHRKTAAAAGGCILIRSRLLDAIGGIESIRGELIDDCALAQRVKAAAGRVWLGVTTQTRSLRKYESWRELEHMISRTAFTQLRYSTFILLGTVLAMSLTFLVPPVLVLAGGITGATGLVSWILMSLCFWPTLRLYRLSPLWACTLPLIAIFYMGATIHSAVLHWAGRGGLWKGRVHDTAGI